MAKLDFKKNIKVKHFAAKTVSLVNSTDIESFVTELFIAFLLAVFAYQGYLAKLALLLFPCAIGSVACFFISMRTLYWVIKERLELKRRENNEI